MAEGIEVARRAALELVNRGAVAIVLTGSHARGDATGSSDLDLIVVGDGPGYELEIRDGLLVAQAWASEEEHRSRLLDPGLVGSVVPGWREAVVLHDPTGVAVTLKREALGWDWHRLEDRCDAWVAERLVGFAEEVQKLTAALAAGRTLTAAVQRSVLALRLAPILAVHHRLLYGSENVLWERLGELMGAEWPRVQASALGTTGETFEASCRAALTLFRLAVDSVSHLLSADQRAVVHHALAVRDGDPVIVRWAQASDVPALAALAARTWSDAFADSVSPEDAAAELHETRSERYFLAALRQKTILVAEAGEGLLGYAQAGDVEIPEIDVRPGDRALQRLYVDESEQGRGLGRRLLEFALQHPPLDGAKRIFLTVWARNERAIRLYESVGFKAVGTTRFTIGSEPVEDLVMVLDRGDVA